MERQRYEKNCSSVDYSEKTANGVTHCKSKWGNFADKRPATVADARPIYTDYSQTIQGKDIDQMKRLILPTLIAGAALLTLPRALAEVVITLEDGRIIRVGQVDHIQVSPGSDGGVTVTYRNGETAQFTLGEMARMTFDDVEITDPEPPVDPNPPVNPSDDPEVITVEWSADGGAPTVACSAPDVTVEIDGGNVTLTNTNTTTEYTYVLRGKSAAGSLTLVAEYKSTIRLEGLDLTSQAEEALNIKCGKRIALQVMEGTVNSLADSPTDNGQKGALYCKGHLEVEGAGTLNLTGHTKHALSTKEYVQLKKKFTGHLNVLGAPGDGIHAGQYFQMNGGNVSIKGIDGDGIQAELTDNPEDEQNGQLIIKGGTLDITAGGTDIKGLKADTDITLTGGTLCIAMSGPAGKGIKADGNIVIGDETTGEGPILSITTTGATYNDGSSGSTGGGTGGWGGGWGGGRPPGGGPGGESSGSAAKAIKAQGTYTQWGGNIFIHTTGSKAEGIESKTASTTSMNFNGGTLYVCAADDCINSAGQMNFAGANLMCISTGNDAIDSNYGRTGAITITGGVILAFASQSPEMAFDCDNMAYVVFKGGTAVGGGGNQGGGGGSSSGLGSGSQHYKWWSTSLSYSVGRYYSVYAGGKNLFTFTLPLARSSSYNLYGCDAFTSGTTYTVGYTTAAPTEAEETILFRTSATDPVGTPLFWRKSNITSGTQATTFSPN